MQKTQFDIAIVGGGIVGLATAFQLQTNFPKLNIVVFEKEKELAFHQTGRNSGVIHSGLYYKSGSFKANNCVKGRKLLVNFAKGNEMSNKTNVEQNIERRTLFFEHRTMFTAIAVHN